MIDICLPFPTPAQPAPEAVGNEPGRRRQIRENRHLEVAWRRRGGMLAGMTGVMTGAEVAVIERIAAQVEAAVAPPLARLAPDLAPTASALGGGQLVLLGPGMYVNRAMALGLGVSTTDDDLATVERCSLAAGVAPEVEVSALAHPSLLERTSRRGYEPTGFRNTLFRAVRPEDQDAGEGALDVQEVADDAGLSTWQATVAEGYGYTTAEQRRTSDLYVAALHQLPAAHLYIARLEREPVGVASLSIEGHVAILGGMSTIPSARRRGVQAQLIRHRLATAAAAGCLVARSTADPGGGSERNLLRSRFSVATTTLTMRLATPLG